VAEFIPEPDAEAVIVAYLNAQFPSTSLPTLKASTKVPATRPARFVIIRKVGGFRRNLVSFRPRFVVESYGPNEAAAAAVASLVGALLWQAATDGAMGSTVVGDLNTVSLPQNLPDPAVTSASRYSSSYELDMRSYGA